MPVEGPEDALGLHRVFCLGLWGFRWSETLAAGAKLRGVVRLVAAVAGGGRGGGGGGGVAGAGGESEDQLRWCSPKKKTSETLCTQSQKHPRDLVTEP